MDQNEDRLPLPSEDEGDLAEEPRGAMTDDPLVATEEGVPYDPPSTASSRRPGIPEAPRWPESTLARAASSSERT